MTTGLAFGLGAVFFALGLAFGMVLGILVLAVALFARLPLVEMPLAHLARSQARKAQAEAQTEAAKLPPEPEEMVGEVVERDENGILRVIK